jgi:hypothetical protein
MSTSHQIITRGAAKKEKLKISAEQTAKQPEVANTQSTAHSKQSDNHSSKSTICTKKSKSSSVEARKKQLILEAEKEKAKIRLELIEKTLEADLAALDDVASSAHSQKSHHSVDVEKWIDHSCQVSKQLPSVQDITAAHDAPVSYAMVQQPIPNPSTGTDIEKLATALTQAIQTSTSTMQNEQNQQLLSRIAASKDLPLYFGDPNEWLHFKETYLE